MQARFWLAWDEDVSSIRSEVATADLSLHRNLWHLPIEPATIYLSAAGSAPDRMKKTEIRRMVSAAAAACEGKKAERIRVLELDPADSGFTDYFLISSGANQRQNQAIADSVEKALKQGFGTTPNSIEGYRQGDWILLDYVDFVVHVFSNEKREFYDIERLRRTAVPLTLEELKASLRRKPATTQKKPAVAKKKAAAKSIAKNASTKRSPAKKTMAGKVASTKRSAKNASAKRPARKISDK